MEELIGRNDPCPCGSGKKYKKCCMGKPVKPKFTARVIRSGGEIPQSPEEEPLDLMKRFNEVHTIPSSPNFEMTKRDFRVNKS